MEADVIGNFPKVDPNCAGCGKPLVIENAWMTDGCPCNTPLGVNSMNETRWRLLMQLQQRQSFEIEKLRSALIQSRALLMDRANASSWWNDNRMFELFHNVLEPLIGRVGS